MLLKRLLVSLSALSLAGSEERTGSAGGCVEEEVLGRPSWSEASF